ncbi:hypothetical protein FA95DRAFT_1340343 [Auriscalpium vulgare]|uniref:Uncharacterized protein n=1 Tax=Auriscalpium vulgare TaxID=40419 RepID=A0ACB8RRH2_9AGAM|nr:hypothetical protein FA95DRAFT_1340343 [Auriscalpium vulgare]
MAFVDYLRRAYRIPYRGLAGKFNVRRTRSRKSGESGSPSSLDSNIASNDPPCCPTTELPLDIHILIIEWVFRLSQHMLIDHTTLRACALVCRAWTPAAQRLLFRRIRCTSLHDSQCNIQLLVSTLGIRPHLAAHVRCIYLTWPTYPREYVDVCIRLLELCRHVEGVSFLRWGASNFTTSSTELDARLHAIQLKPVVLDVDGILDHTVSSSIARMCPGPRVLVLTANHDYPLPPTLEALEILGDRAHGCLSHSHPLPALRYLCLMSPSWPGPLDRHLISTGILPHLQSLHIRGIFPPPEILDQLAQLRTLVVSALSRKHVDLPRSLRYFGYHAWGVPPDARSELVVGMLRALPGLQLVTVTRDVERHVRIALERMCHDIGVDFGIYETPFHFQEPRHIDWI